MGHARRGQRIGRAQAELTELGCIKTVAGVVQLDVKKGPDRVQLLENTFSQYDLRFAEAVRGQHESPVALRTSSADLEPTGDTFTHTKLPARQPSINRSPMPTPSRPADRAEASKPLPAPRRARVALGESCSGFG